MSRRIEVAPVSAPIEPFFPAEIGGGVTLLEKEELRLGPSTEPRPAAPGAASGDDYIDRLVKYIPTEIIALYLGAINVVPAKDSSRILSLWIIAALCLICTPVYMYYATRKKGKPTLWSQITIGSIAFPIWVFAIGGPFAYLSWYDDKRWIAAIVVTFATFIAGIYKPQSARAA